MMPEQRELSPVENQTVAGGHLHPFVAHVSGAPAMVGAVVKVRKLLRSTMGVVLEVHGKDRLVILLPQGDVREVPARKVRAVIAQPVGVHSARSVTGRYRQFLSSPDVAAYRTQAMESVVRERLEVLLTDRSNALGLLLDHDLLVLSFEECRQLPIEPWRVAYEFFRGKVANGKGPDPELAAWVLASVEAPLDLRLAVMMAFAPAEAASYLASTAAEAPPLPVRLSGVIPGLKEEFSEAQKDGHPAGLLMQQIIRIGESGPAYLASEELLADRTIWEILLAADVESDPDSGPAGLEYFCVARLRAAGAAVAGWQWKDARQIARDTLRVARIEAIRDELLNIIACSLWMEGQNDAALAALDMALEGEYTEALLVNASVVASELEHDSALARLVRLAQEAPTSEQRAIAAERALILWDDDDSRVWEEADNEPLPSEIRNALRPLIREALAEERYVRLLRVLATRDAEWLGRQDDQEFGGNAGRPAASIFRARARGLDDFVEALAGELHKGANTPDWLWSERDAIVQAAIQVLLDNNDQLPAAIFGLMILDANLPMNARDELALKALTVSTIARGLDLQDGEPQERFVDLLIGARSQLAMVDPGDRAALKGLVSIASNQLALCFLNSRARNLDEIASTYRNVCLRAAEIALRPGVRLNLAAVRQSLAPIVEFTSDTSRLLARLQQLLLDDDLRDAVTELSQTFSDWERKVPSVTEATLIRDAGLGLGRFGS